MTITEKIKEITSLSQRFVKDQSAVATIEFAFIAPLLIATYLGCVEISRAYIIKNRIETITETVADLVAQGTAIDEAQLADIFSISTSMLSEEEQGNFNIIVTAVRTEPQGAGSQTTVQWSESLTGNNTHAQDSVYDELPDGVAQNFETIIVTELVYTHRAMLEFFIKGEKRFERRFLNKPRYSADIPCTDCNG